MRKLTYLAVFETDENPGISVYFPGNKDIGPLAKTILKEAGIK